MQIHEIFFSGGSLLPGHTVIRIIELLYTRNICVHRQKNILPIDLLSKSMILPLIDYDEKKSHFLIYIKYFSLLYMD